MDGAASHLPGPELDGRDYQGRSATFAYFGQLAQETGGTFRPSCSAWLQTVITAWSASGAAPRTERQASRRPNCVVFELKDGRVRDGREHFEDLYAWDELPVLGRPARARQRHARGARLDRVVENRHPSRLLDVHLGRRVRPPDPEVPPIL